MTAPQLLTFDTVRDELVDPVSNRMWAYGPSKTYMLAKRKLDQGGGATRASTNADSYAWLANSKFFYDLTGYFPRPDNYKGTINIDTYSKEQWIQEEDGFMIDYGTITETTTDDEMKKRRDDILDAFKNPTPNAAKPSAGKSLSIAMMTAISPHIGRADIDNTWRFYTTTVGHAVGCDWKSNLVQEITPEGPSDAKLPNNVDSENLPWPAGDFKLNIEGEECYYKCDGTNAGRLFCPQREISCQEDSAKSKADGINKCNPYVRWHAAVYCDF